MVNAVNATKIYTLKQFKRRAFMLEKYFTTIKIIKQKKMGWDFSGGPMAKTLHSQQKRPEFGPWSGH